MRVLVTWGSKRGGTEGIARGLADALRAEGIDVEARAPDELRDVARYNAVIVGGALYANRWHSAARRFVTRHVRTLRTIPVWFFSSGPLDESADHTNIAPVRQVESLMERVGAQGHVTFGGRLLREARGFPASAMAKTHAGDWRNPDRIRSWACDIADALPTARPGIVTEHPGHSMSRVLVHAVVGWAMCATAMLTLLNLTSRGISLAAHALVVPMVFAFVARHYFMARGARDPVVVASVFTATVAVLDLAVVAGLGEHSLAMFRSLTGTWLPFALIFGVTWAMGEAISMGPLTRPVEAK
jgi:menaquinone-dependent protoporphyrinogen oxidase